MQINAELELALRMSGTSSATKTKNTQPEPEPTGRRLPDSGRPQEGTRPSTSVTQRGLG